MSIRIYVVVCSVCGPNAGGAALTRAGARGWDSCGYHQIGIDPRKHKMNIVVGVISATKAQEDLWLAEERKKMKEDVS